MPSMSTDKSRSYWRSLEQLQETDEFRNWMHREFPVAASEFPEGMSRRRWMQLMGASLALGGLTACRYEKEQFAPFALRPENRIPGEPQYFATSIEFAGMPRHLIATCYDGRPIKLEGNVDHPASRGGTDVWSQASILDLYDPDRSAEVYERTGSQRFPRSWDDFVAALKKGLSRQNENGGEGLAILVEPTSSPAMQQSLQKLLERYPSATIAQHGGLSRDQELAGTQLVCGRPLRTHADLSKARVIVSLDCDLLGVHPSAMAHVRAFAEGRTPDPAKMNRLYVAESTYSTTGTAADHRMPMSQRELSRLAAYLHAQVLAQLAGQAVSEAAPKLSESQQRIAAAMVSDLVANQGTSLVAVGSSLPAEVHALMHDVNRRLGNIGQTVKLTAETPLAPSVVSLATLVERMQAGTIECLIILGGNPAYDAPGDVPFEQSLAKVPMRVRLGVYDDETSALCTWHVPEAHGYESWDALRAWDGLISVKQPLIEPLLGGYSPLELLAVCTADKRTPEQMVRDAVAGSAGRAISETDWQKVLHDGFLPGTQYASVDAASVVGDLDAKLGERTGRIAEATAAPSDDSLEILWTLSRSVLDGRFANNGWLQETPDTATKITWDNAALVAPRTAERLQVKHGQVIRLQQGDTSVEVPVYVLPGQADNTLSIAVGYGRTHAGVVGGDVRRSAASVGVNIHPLRSFLSPYVSNQVSVTRTDKMHLLATTQDHHAIDTVGMEEIGRRVGQLVREASVQEFAAHPEVIHHGSHHPPLKSLWEEPSYEGHAWGMAIDLNKCIGCNACVVACQAENNVPIVGKDQVSKGREMHWLRVDRYFQGDVDDPQVVTQPVTCHHCENAPCEQVCPVAATVHSDEGLNDMVYNRCVGTRYCANNCPYKVRRFNFFDYNKQLEEPNRQLAQLVINPEVTVRTRGVMEKCTYCVQRIQRVKIDARNEVRPMRDGELMTACQQACPAQAISFGDLNDKKSHVSRQHADPRAYGMLEELNVKPRTRYLARIRNPHPDLAAAMSSSHDGHGSVEAGHTSGGSSV
jgi:molybdopterin-containing oxidoreductase family iron-sulfur binding subunit